MEIKYTIEILTKDIQDIEKLVGNLQNSKDNSALELDLALSKLRNVYEILTMIKADRLHELVNHASLNEEPSAGTAQTREPEPAPLPEPVPQAVAETLPEPQPVDEPLPEPQHVAETLPEPQPVAETVPGPEAIIESGPKPEPYTKSGHADPSILAEKFSKESSINENLAEKRRVDLDKKLLGQPIDNISRNIGINDRFYIIRELFKGDSDQFSKLMKRLDSVENFQEANRILKEEFPESMDHEGVEILSGLVRRRHIQ